MYSTTPLMDNVRGVCHMHGISSWSSGLVVSHVASSRSMHPRITVFLSKHLSFSHPHLFEPAVVHAKAALNESQSDGVYEHPPPSTSYEHKLPCVTQPILLSNTSHPTRHAPSSHAHPYTSFCPVHAKAVVCVAHASTTPMANSALLKLCLVAKLTRTASGSASFTVDDAASLSLASEPDASLAVTVSLVAAPSTSESARVAGASSSSTATTSSHDNAVA
mmetsp:Transcript_3412/g.11376  ORF Transcript_3412/g.11376 Transcript_3412/m.11376 type:complete len:220 (-) Transcript_3412:527-1186(-)